MAFAAGVFSRLYNWVTDRDASVPITASRMDAELDGMATALSACVLKDGTQTITANIPMSGFLFTGTGAATARTHLARADQVQDGSLKYAAVSGTDTYTATLVPAITAYTNGLTFVGKFTNANTGAATLNLNSVGAVDIKKAGGAALVSGDIGANTVHTLVYNSTGPKFELVSPSSNAYQPLDADLTAIAAATVLRGAIIYGNSTPAWAALTVGGANTVLRSNGTDVSWGTIPTAAIADNAVTGAKIAMGSDAQGDVLYYNGTDYARLAAGAAGMSLRTQGAAANPTFMAPMFRATTATAQSLTASTWVKIQFGTETFDTNANYDAATNYRFTPTVAGKYLLTVAVSANITKDMTLKVALYKNGSAVAVSSVNHTGAGTDRNFTIQVTDIADANGSTDYFEGYAWCDDVTPSTLIADATLNIFTGTITG